MSDVQRIWLSGVTALTVDGRLTVMIEGEAVQDDLLVKEGRFVRAADIAAVLPATGRLERCEP